ncbi:hypothetical protein ACKI1O_47840, partial [Streptomyces scabiei]
TVSDRDLLPKETVLKSIEEYEHFYTTKTNNKEEVTQNTYALNELLNAEGIKEKLRSQFVGTCLLVLKNTKAKLTSKDMNTDMILGEMKRVLGELLNHDVNKAEKIAL